jgi:hypothetical protein
VGALAADVGEDTALEVVKEDGTVTGIDLGLRRKGVIGGDRGEWRLGYDENE